MTVALLLARESTTIAPWNGWSLLILVFVAAVAVAAAGELAGRNSQRRR